MEELSPREREVLDAVGARLTNQEIAAKLFIGVRTVESHVSALLRKLGVTDRRALAAMAPEVLGVIAAPAAAVIDAPVTPSPSLIGRDAEVAAVRALLDAQRLVTLVGVGGVGKTSLAQASVPPGTPFVDLTKLPAGADVDAVGRALLDALRLDEVPSRAPVDEVVAHLRRAGRVTVVVDNCEHVVDAAADVVADLVGRTDATVLATSRERLAIRGERVHPVGGLDHDAAVELFTRRAVEAVGPDTFDPVLVAGLCDALDGLPLAIELAAARLAVFPLAELMARVGRSVDLLDGGDRTRRRHRSVRDMLAWSHDLLAEPERAVHRRLAVLPGAFRLAAAEHVAAGSPATSVVASIGRLVDASLLVREGDR